MKRNEVIKLFRITKLDNKTIDNILEMNALSLDSSGNYDTKKCCRVFANAGKLYHTYIPDYIAANLLNTSIDDLINMNLEFVIAPVKYQGIFYDEYGKENLTFQYSKYLFNIIPILTMASFYARELYLEIIPDIFELYPDRFLTLEDTVRALYMSHINSYLYHYYLMRMKIRFAYVKGVRRYFLDDIENVLEMAQDFFESNISDIELSQHYSYACYCFMVKYLEKDGGIYTVFPDYDVVLSDKRFPNGFQESTRYYSKKKVNHAYYWWFIHYNCMICNVNPPLSRKYNLYVEVSINNTQGYYYDPVYGITVRKLHNISETYDNNQILGVLEIEDADELLYEPYSNSRSKYIYYIYGFSKINSDVFDIEICKLLHRRFTYISNLSSITELISSLFSTYLFETAFNNYKEGDINDFESYHIFKNSHVLISGIPQSHTETTPWTYAWCNVILNKSPFLDYVEGYNRNITYIELRKIYSMKYYNLKDLDTHQAYFYDSRIIDHIKGKSFLYDYKAQVSKITKLLPLEKSENYKYITSAPSEYRIVNHISNNKDYFTLKETITFLNIKEYSFKLIWYILCNCGLSITFFDLMIYFNKKEILSLYDQLKKITDEYTSFDHINYISHGKPYFIRCNYSVLIIDMCYAYLLSLEHPCYVFLSGISDNYIDHINNYPYHCKLFLTNAEVNRNLKLLPAKIPGTLVNRLLNVNKDTKYYKTNEWKYFNKNNVFRMREQLNELVELYVPEDKIPEYVDKNISCLTKADLKILESIPSINIPEFAISSCDWFEGSSTSNRAYTKEDIHYIQYYLHEEFNYLINYSKLLVANDIYNVNTYQTYKLRLDLFVSKYNLDSECETYNLWNGYIKLKLDMNRASERTVNTKINQYIKAYYTLDYMLKKLNIKSVYLINTSFINRIFDNNIPITYSKILLGFFRYVSSVYKSRLIKVSFNVREIKIPENHKLPFIDMISQTYSFDEYSIIFDYCNNYSIHIKKSLDEITNTGTCTYASTWFYIMCHLNNAWRSADFTYFPNINIKKIIDRNISDKGYSWFLDSNLSNSDSKIIILDLQSNPKVVSKTKKNTVFMCSNELLTTFTTVYLLLSYYTSFLSFDTELICHFNNHYNGLSRRYLNNFFRNIKIPKFEFKSRKMNKTLLSLIDFMEDYYIDNDFNEERREAMLLRSHVSSESTAHYIKKTQNTFDRLTNMLCARGEFGYVYEYLINIIHKKDLPKSMEETTTKIRKIRRFIPDISDVNNIFSFMNFTKEEKNRLSEYINSLSMSELQSRIAKLYLKRSPSKMSINVLCLKKTCDESYSSDNCACAHCIFHIPSLYALVTICRSIKYDLKEYMNIITTRQENEVLRIKSLRKVIKKSRDILLANKIYEREILEEIFNLSGIYFDDFIAMVQ